MFTGTSTVEKQAMLSERPGRAVRPIGPSGKPLTLADLPPPNTKRWVPKRKAELVAAVRGGLISLDDVSQRYGISEEEFQSWEKGLAAFGVKGLRTTRAQLYRKAASRSST